MKNNGIPKASRPADGSLNSMFRSTCPAPFRPTLPPSVADIREAIKRQTDAIRNVMAMGGDYISVNVCLATIEGLVDKLPA